MKLGLQLDPIKLTFGTAKKSVVIHPMLDGPRGILGGKGLAAKIYLLLFLKPMRLSDLGRIIYDKKEGETIPLTEIEKVLGSLKKKSIKNTLIGSNYVESSAIKKITGDGRKDTTHFRASLKAFFDYSSIRLKLVGMVGPFNDNEKNELKMIYDEALNDKQLSEIFDSAFTNIQMLIYYEQLKRIDPMNFVCILLSEMLLLKNRGRTGTLGKLKMMQELSINEYNVIRGIIDNVHPQSETRENDMSE